jgi:hypothetical protein
MASDLATVREEHPLRMPDPLATFRRKIAHSE